MDKPLKWKSAFQKRNCTFVRRLGLAVITLLKKLLTEAIDYRNYRVFKKFDRYEDDIGKKLNNVARTSTA